MEEEDIKENIKNIINDTEMLKDSMITLNNIVKEQEEDLMNIEDEIKKSLSDISKAKEDLEVSNEYKESTRINYLYLFSTVAVFFYLNFFKIT